MYGMRRRMYGTAAGFAALAFAGALALRADDAAAKKAETVPIAKAAAKPVPAAAPDPKEIVALQERLAKLDAERTAAAAELARMNDASVAAFRDAEHAVAVCKGLGGARYCVAVRHSKQRANLYVDDVPGLACLARLLAKDTPRPQFVGIGLDSYAADPETLLAIRAAFREHGFAVLKISTVSAHEMAQQADPANPAVARMEQDIPPPPPQPATKPGFRRVELAPRIRAQDHLDDFPPPPLPRN